MGVWEVGDTADVIGVEVRDHDVANVLAAEAESVELVCRGLARHEHRSGDEADRAHPCWRVGAVVDPEAGVDENQAVIGLDEQHMTDAVGRARRVHRAAIEMVDLH